MVLWSVNWWGPNFENYLRVQVSEDLAKQYNMNVMMANWSGVNKKHKWNGQGYSCGINRTGKVISMAKTLFGKEIVYADFKIHKIKRSLDSMTREELISETRNLRKYKKMAGKRLIFLEKRLKELTPPPVSGQKTLIKKRIKKDTPFANL